MLVAPRFATKLADSVMPALAEKLPPWGPVGYCTYKRTYARMTPHGRTEEWHETVERGCNGLLEIGGVFTHEQIKDLAYYWYNLKGMPAGRPLWQLGTDTVRTVGGDSLQNCWHVAVDGPIDPFTFTFNQLMLGGGVGFSVDPEYVYALPVVKYAPTISRVDDYDCDYVVTDNRAGWVELLRRVLECFFYTGKDFRYDTRCIRPSGRPIKGFGGVASGPEKLVEGIGEIAELLTRARGRKLRPTECMDIMNIIGMIVVAGNVRRSAEIAVGSYTDREYLEAKDWSRKSIPPWRQQSNNTVRCADPMLLPDYFWRGYTPGNGEAYGLFNDELCKHYGRLTDGYDYRPDLLIVGPNPCGEILLESHEACNLAEHFLPNISSVTEFGNIAALLLRAAKAIGRMPFWHPKTNEVVARNNRLGLSVTGYLQSDFVDDAEAFDAVYDHLEREDLEVSRLMGCKPSIKLTTVKPSGTLSLLAGCTPGVHAAFSEHYIRRITFSSDNPLADAARDRGYNVQPKINIDSSRDLGSLVVDFPIKVPAGTQTAKGYSAVAQLENQLFLQKHWADNSVSCTIYYQAEELPEIHEWLREHYAHGVKTTSFLLHSEHGFIQAPYEEITEDQYYEMSARVRPIMNIEDTMERSLTESDECRTGACPAR